MERKYAVAVILILLVAFLFLYTYDGLNYFKYPKYTGGAKDYDAQTKFMDTHKEFYIAEGVKIMNHYLLNNPAGKSNIVMFNVFDIDNDPTKGGVYVVVWNGVAQEDGTWRVDTTVESMIQGLPKIIVIDTIKNVGNFEVVVGIDKRVYASQSAHWRYRLAEVLPPDAPGTK